MKKKEIDYSKIVVLENKIQELKNKVLLNYINSINENEKKASKKVESLSNKLNKDRKILKREKKDLKDFRLLYRLSCFLGVFSVFAIFLASSFISAIIIALCALYYVRHLKEDYVKPIEKSILKRKKRIKINEDLLESNRLIVSESKSRISKVTTMPNSKLFSKLENELLKSGISLEEIYSQYVQILSDFENEVSDKKSNVENVMKSPLMVDTIDVLYETRYQSAKNKNLQLKK